MHMSCDVETDTQAGRLRGQPGTRRLLVIFFMALFAVLAVASARSPLSETDEGFAANRALSFERHHSWILTYDDVDSDEPQFRKPPLFYWFVAGSYRLFGVTPFAARLPAVVASLGVCLLLFFAVRRQFGTWCAVSSAVLPLTVPFIFAHMTSAMLEMPFILCVLSAILLFSKKTGWKAAAGSGLLVGAAFLIKGEAGLAGAPLAIVIALFWRQDRTGFARDAAVLAVGALLPLAAYFAALPEPYARAALQNLLVREPVHRITTDGYERGFAQTVINVHAIMLWQGLAGFAGLALLGAGSRDVQLRRWFALALALIAVSIVVTAMSHPPYPRYAIPGMLLLLSTSAYFCRRVTDGSAARWLLLPVAAACLFIDGLHFAWMPFAACVVVFAAQVVRVPSVSRERIAPILATLLLASFTLASAQSPAAWHSVQRDHRWDQPDIIPLAVQAGELVPPGEKVLVYGKFKCHAVLFYSRRRVESVAHWILGQPEAGESRYMIMDGWLPVKHPGVDVQPIARSGSFRLSRITVTAPQPTM